MHTLTYPAIPTGREQKSRDYTLIHYIGYIFINSNTTSGVPQQSCISSVDVILFHSMERIFDWFGLNGVSEILIKDTTSKCFEKKW